MDWHRPSLERGSLSHRPSRRSLTRRALLRSLAGGTAVAATPALATWASMPSAAAATARPTGDRVLGGRWVAAPRSATGSLVMIIRHAEKPPQGSAGIDLNGRPDTHSLTMRGWTRAAYLPTLFVPPDGAGPAPLPAPSAIFASGLGKGDGEGTRVRQTVGPLAQELGVKVDTTFSRGQEAAVAAAAARHPGITLICWQHGEIPAIAEALGAAAPNPPRTWPDERFDVVWIFSPTPAGGWRFDQMPEMLLPGDASQGF